MFYQYTGQPGHGKTVLALESAILMKRNADALHEQDPEKHPYRELYVCNVRDFNHIMAGGLPVSPDEIRGWADHPDYVAAIQEFESSEAFLHAPTDKKRDQLREEFHRDPVIRKLANEQINPMFENAIILVDEAYEHEMFPRRPPGRTVPRHVERVAKHRHFGIDFIMICQSPKKQMDDFLHDLIEEHYHIRRRFGLPFAHVKRWDKYEPNPDKADSLTTTRRRYPKWVFALYTSTKYDTSEKRVPWFYYAAAALLVACATGAWFVFGRIDEALTPKDKKTAATAQNGAGATVGAGAVFGPDDRPKTATEYAQAHLPRFGTMPWTAPVFDERSVTADPQLVCASSLGGLDAQGKHMEPSCSCLTEQGTAYDLPQPECRLIARRGPVYNPYKQRQQDRVEPAQQRQAAQSAHAPTGGVVSYRSGARGDIFPNNPAVSASSYTGATSTL